MNKLIVFTAPSGAGKTTIVRYLLEKYDHLAFSISATTRGKRINEEDGKDYYFISEEKFRKLIDEGAFLEWEEVYPGVFYGTLKSEIERLWSKGKDVVFDIDVKGAANIKKAYADCCYVVFVKPPSLEVLIKRLVDRETETEESLNTRIAKLKEELAYAHTFDYCLLNDGLEDAFRQAEQLIEDISGERGTPKTKG